LHLLRCWEQVVPSNTAQHSRPLYLHRGVLSVATSSAAWAQTLSLGRYQLIQKLTPLLGASLQDIRFSPAQWTRSKNSSGRYLAEARSSSTSFSNCPNCQSLCRDFEIERWGLCACCIAQVWSKQTNSLSTEADF
jgi:predicted nucleic acid-binding Zn ribbon protein